MEISVHLLCHKCGFEFKDTLESSFSDVYVNTEHECIPILEWTLYKTASFVGDRDVSEEAFELFKKRIEENDGIFCFYHIKFGRTEWRCTDECKINRGGYLCKEKGCQGWILDGKCSYCGIKHYRNEAFKCECDNPDWNVTHHSRAEGAFTVDRWMLTTCCKKRIEYTPSKKQPRKQQMEQEKRY